MEFSIIATMQILSGIVGAWIGFVLTERFFTKLRQEEEQEARRKKFDADVNFIRNSVRDISAELTEMERRFNNGPCANGVCSIGNGKTFNCDEAYKDLERQLRELERTHNINPTETPV